jgi:hypothetical protein
MGVLWSLNCHEQYIAASLEAEGSLNGENLVDKEFDKRFTQNAVAWSCRN